MDGFDIWNRTSLVYIQLIQANRVNSYLCYYGYHPSIAKQDVATTSDMSSVKIFNELHMHTCIAIR